MTRIEPTWAQPDDDMARTLCDAVPQDGRDTGAAHRAMMRARTTAAQQAEAQQHAAFRAHQVDVLADEKARSYRRPRGAGWPATLRSVRSGKEDA
jgi:hypothetical protein